MREENDKSSEVDCVKDECKSTYYGERSSELGSDSSSFDGSIEDGDSDINEDVEDYKTKDVVDDKTEDVEYTGGRGHSNS